MPFPSEQLVEQFSVAVKKERLSHAYLLTGDDPEEVETLGKQLAAILLGAPAEEHPDFYLVRPQSKSRRITIEQIRTLEKSLYLKPFKAPCKVAFIMAAERMCLGQAEPANAFLKTLEEPPSATFLILGTTRPSMLLPTILSRCLRLDTLSSAEKKSSPEISNFLKKWFENKTPGAIRAYARAALLNQIWQSRQEKLEEDFAAKEETDSEEETQKAMIESELQLMRQETIAALQREYWSLMTKDGFKDLTAGFRSIAAIEELQHGMQLNLEINLAVERTVLKIEGLI